MATVRKLITRRRTAVYLSQAMQEAIRELGGNARVMDVAQWIHRNYSAREWRYSSIASYFSMMSRQPLFTRTARGQYRVATRYKVAA